MKLRLNRSNIIIIVLCVLAVILGTALLLRSRTDAPAPAIISYEQCLQAAGSRQLATNPAQCETAGGRLFTEPDTLSSSPAPALSPTPAPTVNPNFVACTKAAGSTIRETSPRQCRTAAGNLYVENNGQL